MRNLRSQRMAGASQWIALAVIASSFCGCVLWTIVGVTGFFRLSSDTAALRTTFIKSHPGVWDTKIALRAGWLTASAVRFASGFIELPPEPRAALAAFKGADVGIYRLAESDTTLSPIESLRATDHAMQSRGWDRIVGVADGEQLVAVYWPREIASAAKVKCCVLVFDGRELIVSSARLSLKPLMDLAASHLDLGQLEGHVRSGL